MKRQTQGVLWTKGVLLNPQHLQTQDRYLEDKLAFHVSSLAFCPWGFTAYEIDEDALEGGQFRLVAATGMFPDGLVFDCPAADTAPAPRSVEEHWKPDQERMLVHLAIPELRRGGRNVSGASDDQSTRYSPEVLAVRDENTGQAEKEILVARKNFRILFENEVLEGSSTMPVARLMRAPSGATTLDPDFIPEVLDISASRALTTMVRRLFEILSAKASELGAMRRGRGRQADFGRLDIAHFWLLYTVNTHLPVFRQLVAGETDAGERMLRRAHPARLYRAMAELAATLMTFAPGRHPRDLPAYDHDRLSECLPALDVLVRELLETSIPTNCVTLPLSEVEPSLYAVSLDEERHLSAVQAYLAVTSEMDQARLIEKLPNWVKVGSRDQIDDLLKQAVSGVSVRHQPSPPQAIPLKGGSQYFHLETSGPRWSAILQSRSFATWAADEIDDPRFELVLLLPEEDRPGD